MQSFLLGTQSIYPHFIRLPVATCASKGVAQIIVLITNML